MPRFAHTWWHYSHSVVLLYPSMQTSTSSHFSWTTLKIGIARSSKNTRSYLPINKVSCCYRLESSSRPLWEIQILCSTSHMLYHNNSRHFVHSSLWITLDVHSHSLRTIPNYSTQTLQPMHTCKEWKLLCVKPNHKHRVVQFVKLQFYIVQAKI